MPKKSHHYIPKFYLKGFTESSESPYIWVYERGKAKPFRANISNVAHENYFYTLPVPPDKTNHLSPEDYLAEKIEAPANPVIEKIRNNRTLSDADRVNLSIYLAVMLKRIPRHRKRIQELAPKVASNVENQIEQIIDTISKRRANRPELKRKLRGQAKSIIRRLEENPPKEVLFPDYSIKVTQTIFRMSWQFFISEEKFSFLTSDNPLFFFEGIGIGQDNSEITFPISSDCVLWATNRTDLMEGYYKINQDVKDEFNSRIASLATRYVYYSQEVDWVAELVNQDDYSLKRIV